MWSQIETKRRRDEETECKGRAPISSLLLFVSPSLSRQRGFSFAEVMFAVIILGVGFIMIAALFPVAISQSKSNTDETNAASYAKASAACFEAVATDTVMSSTLFSTTGLPLPQVASIPLRTSAAPADNAFTRRLFESIRGNMISAEDPRYAWIPFYIRGNDLNGARLPYAKLLVICVQSTLTSTFTSADVDAVSPTRANLRGRPVAIKVANGDDFTGDPDLIGFQDSGTYSGAPSQLTNTKWDGAVQAVAEGCFVIVRGHMNQSFDEGRLTGKIYRVGIKRPDITTTADSVYYTLGPSPTKKTKPVNFSGMSVWELVPGYDFQYMPEDHTASVTLPEIGAIDDSAGRPAEAWIVGRSFSSPTNDGAQFEGPAMDVSAFTTIVPCKP